MRMTACFLLFCVATPTWAQHKVAQDFRGGKFDADLLRYHGKTPEKFLTLEPQGLRLRYQGKDVPPPGLPAAVAWSLHARGDFTVTGRYEILKVEPPAKGSFAVGPEMYLMLANANKDGVGFARGVYPNGQANFNFNIRTNDAQGKRISRDFKSMDSGERSLKGRLRLERKGTTVIASFAEADDAEFTEFQQAEIGTADVRLIRFTGIAGGDPKAVLDMRFLEFQLEGEDLALNGRFLTPLRKEATPAVKEAAPVVDQAVAPPLAAAAEGKSKLNLLILIGVLFLVLVPALIIVGIVLFLRLGKRAAALAHKPAPRPKEESKPRGVKSERPSK